MSAVVALREDYSGEDLRALAAKARDGAQARRLMALAAVADGKDRREAAAIGLMDRQTLRDWVHRFNADGPDGLINTRPSGRPPELTASQKEELRQIVEDGPLAHGHDVVRWRRIDLASVTAERFGVSYHETTIGRILRQLGLSRISARPSHPKRDEQAAETFKKNFAERVAELSSELPADTPVEIWFQDEARVGQKNGLVYQWAPKGSRPTQPKDQRYETAYIFGAVCPARDEGAALVLPRADTEAMQRHLEEISRTVAIGAHAFVVTDNAGWHTTRAIDIPANLSLLFLPPYSPELNPQENIWQFLRQNYLSSRVFKTYNDIVEACCKAWNKLLAETGRITSIATRSWACIGQ